MFVVWTKQLTPETYKELTFESLLDKVNNFIIYLSAANQ